MLGSNIVSGASVKSILVVSWLTFIFSSTNSYTQDFATTRPSDYFEVKIGDEVKRNVVSFGIGRKFYLVKNFSLAPEITVLGTPFVSGTMRLDAKLGDHVRLSPHFGIGLTPAGLPISGAIILGGDLSYRIDERFVLFLESRFYYINNDIYSLGSGVLKISELNSKRPVVLSLGVGF
jgi:hypothetical protein